ncbi:MAG: SOS response-associated peptidase family protein, partial [Tepidiformaceae bacterium]
GLYESWRPNSEEWQRTFTIVTTTANELLAPFHDRMPVILLPETADQWMDARNSDSAGLQRLLQPAAGGVLVARPVSKRVNSVRYDEPGAIEEEPRLALGE